MHRDVFGCGTRNSGDDEKRSGERNRRGRHCRAGCLRHVSVRQHCRQRMAQTHGSSVSARTLQQNPLRRCRIRGDKPHLLPLFTVGYVPERIFFATATYTTPPDRISGNLPSAKYCNLCCSHNPIASERKLSRKKENGPNPSVTPSTFSRLTLKSKASNCLIE